MSEDENAPLRRQITTFIALDSSQLDYAHELLEEIHPLDDTPLCVAFPWLGVFTMCGVPNYPRYRADVAAAAAAASTEEPLLKVKKTIIVNGKEFQKKSKKKKKNNITDDKQLKAEPLARLGFGIVAYTDILWTLIMVFGLFSVLLYPTMAAFHAGTGYSNVNPDVIAYELGMLGNMGYSSVQCASIPVNVGKLNVMCPFGKVGEILDTGINKDDSQAANCASNEDIDSCKPDATSFIDVLKTTVGKESELIIWSDSDLWDTQAHITECFTEVSRVFVQYTCIQDVSVLDTKYKQMSLAVSTGVLICFLFTIAIRWMYQGGKMKQIDWDMSTITAGDYSVEFQIPREAYDDWKNEYYLHQNGYKERGYSPALALKEHMSEEIGRIMDKWIIEQRAKYEEEKTAMETAHQAELQGASNERKLKANQEKELIELGKKYVNTSLPDFQARLDKKKKLSVVNDGTTKVADIVFAYSNRELILALRARGKTIGSNDFDSMRKEDAKIQELMLQFDELTIPTSAFITFESDDSKEIALENESSYLLLRQEFRFDKAAEPTDIIWENRHFTNQDYLCRQLIAFLIIGVLLLGSFGIILAISNYSAEMASVYTPQDCPGVETAYGDKLEEFANNDYNYVKSHQEEEISVQSSGTLQCFCQKEKVANPDTYLTKVYGGRTDDAKICGYYNAEVSTVYYWTTALSYLLIGINYILRTVCIMLVDKIGFPTETMRLSKTTTVTFGVQFFNSGMLLLLINANLSEQPFGFGLISGSMADFSYPWWRSVGNVTIGAMFFNLYYPLVEAALYWALRAQGRCRDRGCKFSGKVTKTTSIQAYMTVYSGDVYFMHYKYSSIMTITFITFMFGFGMPILFPIAFGSFIVLYLVEKWLLFYGYRIPPMYDEQLSQSVLDKLQFAPILYLMFGYWMASNQQLLSNDYLQPMVQTTDVPVTSHTYNSLFQGEGYNGIKWPMLFALLVLTIVFFFGKLLEKCIAVCFPSVAIGDIELNESIDNYWAALDDEDRKWSTREEENARALLTSKILTDAQFDRLNGIKKTKGHTLQGTHSYDILANPLYFDDFQYVTAAEDGRDQMIIDDDDDEDNDAAQSDLVRVMINLAYLTEDEAKNFVFSSAGLKGCTAGPLGNTKGYSQPLM